MFATGVCAVSQLTSFSFCFYTARLSPLFFGPCVCSIFHFSDGYLFSMVSADMCLNISNSCSVESFEHNAFIARKEQSFPTAKVDSFRFFFVSSHLNFFSRL